jgi:hypothetical protein
MFFLSEGFTFRNFLTDVFAVFMFVLWFWLLIIVIGDLFRVTTYPAGARRSG